MELPFQRVELNAVAQGIEGDPSEDSADEEDTRDSVICATAESLRVLIVGRLNAGDGGTSLYVGTLTLVGYTLPIRKKPVYICIVTSMCGFVSVAGPLLGGLFTGTARLTWHFCFWSLALSLQQPCTMTSVGISLSCIVIGCVAFFKMQ